MKVTTIIICSFLISLISLFPEVRPSATVKIPTTPKPYFCKRPISLFFTCPSECNQCVDPVHCSDIHAAAHLMQFGCSPIPCLHTSSSHELKYGTKYKPNESLLEKESDKYICADKEIHFESVSLKEDEKLDYHLRFRAPGLKTDVYFLVDITGSMNERIGDVVLVLSLIHI